MSANDPGPLVAIPNRLRGETIPNTLGGMRATAVPSSRVHLPLGKIAIVIAGAIAVIWALLGRAS